MAMVSDTPSNVFLAFEPITRMRRVARGTRQDTKHAYNSDTNCPMSIEWHRHPLCGGVRSQGYEGLVGWVEIPAAV